MGLGVAAFEDRSSDMFVCKAPLALRLRLIN